MNDPNTGRRVGPKSGMAMFSLIAPVNWPYVALRCNIENLTKSRAHDIICKIMEAADEHNLVEYIDEIVSDGVLYVTLTMNVRTIDDEDLRHQALAIVQMIVTETRQYAQMREKAKLAHPAGWVSRGSKGQ